MTSLDDGKEDSYKTPLLSPERGTVVWRKLTGMQPPGANALSRFGMTRLCLMVSFIVIAGTTYMYMDTQTLHNFLLMVKEDPYGTLHVFFIAYALSVVLLFPCMILQVISGALYGFWMGFMVSWGATTLGQSLAFLLGRYLFRPTVKSYLHSTWPTFPTIDAAIKKEGWKLVCLLRLSPVLPYNVLNYALAITPVNFWVFSAASGIATVPWTALYVYLGTLSNNLMDLAQGKLDFGGDMQVTRRILSGIFILVTTVYGYIISHRTINAVLKQAAEQELKGSSGGGSGGGAKTNGTSQAGVALMAAHEREHMRDIEAAGRSIE